MIHDGIRMLRLSVRPQALNEDKIKEVKEVCDLYGVPNSEEFIKLQMDNWESWTSESNRLLDEHLGAKGLIDFSSDSELKML